MTLVVVTVTARLAAKPPLPVTVIAHVPGASGVIVNVPFTGTPAVAIPAHPDAVKCPLPFACDSITDCAAEEPTAVNESVAGSMTTTAAVGTAVGATVGAAVGVALGGSVGIDDEPVVGEGEGWAEAVGVVTGEAVDVGPGVGLAVAVGAATGATTTTLFGSGPDDDPPPPQAASRTALLPIRIKGKRNI